MKQGRLKQGRGIRLPARELGNDFGTGGIVTSTIPKQGSTRAGANGTSGSRARRWQRRAMMLLFVLGSLENRRFRENVIIVALALLGLERLAKQNAAHGRARLIAWINQDPSPARPGTG